MTNISKRLKCLADFVDKKDFIADIGCDHGLLSIYLMKNNLCQNVIASDINQNALNNAIKNIKKNNLNIKTILSDGLTNIDTENLNTLIISGMGTTTIKNILSNKNKLKNIHKIIVQSNNDHELLRRSMNDYGYYLKQEKIIFENGKWYITCLFIKSNKSNTNQEIKYGFLNNDEYNNYLLQKKKLLLKKIPLFNKNKLIKYFEYLRIKKAIKSK